MAKRRNKVDKSTQELIDIFFKKGKREKEAERRFLELYGDMKVKCAGADDYTCGMEIIDNGIRFFITHGEMFKSDNGKRVKELKDRFYRIDIDGYILGGGCCVCGG